MGKEKDIAVELLKSFEDIKRTTMRSRTVNSNHKQSELVLLMCLYKSNEPMSISDISKLLQVKMPTITQQVNYLVESGLVEKKVDGTDRRSVQIILTELGTEKSKEIAKNFINHYLDLIEFIGVEDSEQLLRIMKKVNKYYSNLDRKKER